MRDGVGRGYRRWKVCANTTNTGSPRLAGVKFLGLAEGLGWRYSDGSVGPPSGGRFISETYPYVTLVGAPELGYEYEGCRDAEGEGQLDVPVAVGVDEGVHASRRGGPDPVRGAVTVRDRDHAVPAGPWPWPWITPEGPASPFKHPARPYPRPGSCS